MNIYLRHLLAIFIASFFMSLPQLLAKEIKLQAGADLQHAIDQASDGDTLYLEVGEYQGNIIIHRPLRLKGTHQSKIIGDKTTNTIKITADNVTIENLTIMGSGLDLSKQDSGIFVDKNTKNAILRHNHLEDNLIGIYLWGSIDSLVSKNQIIGQKFYRVNDRGNGVQIWNSPGSVVIGNTISYGRDGIFSTTSRENKFIYNYFSKMRYSIHYMYTKDSEVSYNYSKENEIGYALMFSDNLIVKENISINDSERGLFSNFMNKSILQGNIVIGPSKKCLMLYNANYNEVYNNHFEGCLIGVHFTAGSQHNRFKNNSFINNHKQVKYVGTRYLEWSTDKVGNFWSDHPAFDLNTDGVADSVYRPNAITDQILWQNPNAKVLLNSPAIQLLKWSQSHFPALLPGGAQDSYPLLQPPKIIDYAKIISLQPEDVINE